MRIVDDGRDRTTRDESIADAPPTVPHRPSPPAHTDLERGLESGSLANARRISACMHGDGPAARARSRSRRDPDQHDDRENRESVSASWPGPRRLGGRGRVRGRPRGNRGRARRGLAGLGRGRGRGRSRRGRGPGRGLGRARGQRRREEHAGQRRAQLVGGVAPRVRAPVPEASQGPVSLRAVVAKHRVVASVPCVPRPSTTFGVLCSRSSVSSSSRWIRAARTHHALDRAAARDGQDRARAVRGRDDLLHVPAELGLHERVPHRVRARSHVGRRSHAQLSIRVVALAVSRAARGGCRSASVLATLEVERAASSSAGGGRTTARTQHTTRFDVSMTHVW